MTPGAAEDRLGARLQEAMDEMVASGAEVGLQVGMRAVGGWRIDLAAGTTAGPGGGDVDLDTLFPVFSATKGVTATALHVAVAKGWLGYEDRIAAHWPEFGCRGKEGATVRHALTHSIGIPQMPEGVTVEQMCDWDYMTSRVSSLPALWKPGSATGYHSYTFGWVVGELIRRTDPERRAVSRFVREEVCAPARMDDFWLGDLPSGAEVATLVDARPATPRSGLRALAIPSHLDTSEEVFGRDDVRHSCHPAAGGISNAASLAAHYACLLTEGGGPPALAEEQILEMSGIQVDDVDLVLEVPLRKGLGYWIAGPGQAATAPMGTGSSAFGHPGAGGSVGWADRARRIGVAILKNRMTVAGTGRNCPAELGEIIRAEIPAKGLRA